MVVDSKTHKERRRYEEMKGEERGLIEGEKGETEIQREIDRKKARERKRKRERDKETKRQRQRGRVP
jgi:hypothetical protein